MRELLSIREHYDNNHSSELQRNRHPPIAHSPGYKMKHSILACKSDWTPRECALSTNAISESPWGLPDRPNRYLSSATQSRKDDDDDDAANGDGAPKNYHWGREMISKLKCERKKCSNLGGWIDSFSSEGRWWRTHHVVSELRWKLTKP